MADAAVKNIDDLEADSEWSSEKQIQEVVRRWAIHEDGANHKLSFKPSSETVIVAVPFKCGTTWLLHICHQIRMLGAEPNFEYQTDVVTWLEYAEKVSQIDPAKMPQPANPRIFATHLQYSLVPKEGKIIYCFREQKDMLVSAYYFFDTLLSLKGRVSLPNLAQAFMHQVEQNLNDLLLWWEHRHDNNVLLIFFDDLLEDHTGYVSWIAKFIGVDCDKETLARVVHTTTHAEMVRHSSKFNTRTHAAEVARRAGDTLPTEIVGRVRKDGGKSGSGRQLPPRIQQRVDQLWLDIITPKLGFRNFHEMREAWHKEKIATRLLQFPVL